MNVHVLLYDTGTDNEGIHSLELSRDTVVLMFENRDDAERYCLLLEAQDFPKPSIEILEREEVELFCTQAGYLSKFIENGFIPKSDEERLLLSPPTMNRDVSNWNSIEDINSIDKSTKDELDIIKKRLEGLL